MNSHSLHREYIRRLTHYCLAEKKLLAIVAVSGVIGFAIMFQQLAGIRDGIRIVPAGSEPSPTAPPPPEREGEPRTRRTG